MRKGNSIILLFSILIFSFSEISYGQSKKYFSAIKSGIIAIDSIVVVSQLEFLSADNLRGRLTGSDEIAIVADYLLSEFRRLGYNAELQHFRAKDKNGKEQYMQNVLLEIVGEDTTQSIVVGAHYDHLGMAAYGDAYNGADDNASGVVAVLQIARAIKASGLKPKRTIVLALWDGEEVGLHGSKHYVSSHEDISSVNGYLNFDMIGRNSDDFKPKSCAYMYTKSNPEYRKYLEQAIINHNLISLEPDYRAWDNPVSGSDNASFAKQGVPIAWYHTGGHEDYHKPTDTAEKLNWSKMLDIIRSSYVVAWSMAQE